MRQEEHRKAVCWREIVKSDMADHIWKEKGKHLPLCDQAKIIDREEKNHLKEEAHKLGYSNQLSRPSIEMNTNREPLIKKAR